MSLGTIDHCGRGARAKKAHPLYIHSFKVMSAYTDHGKTISTKRNSGQKSTLTERDSRSPFTEKDCFEKSQNYCSTSERIILRSHFHKKTVSPELHKSATTKPIFAESNAQMRK
jgi:hypothetical protein